MIRIITFLLINLLSYSLYGQDQTKPFLLAKAFIMDVVYPTGVTEELNIKPTIWIDLDHAKFYYPNGEVVEFTFKTDRHELRKDQGMIWSYQFIGNDDNIYCFDVFSSVKYPDIRFISIFSENAPKITFECEVVYHSDY